MDTVEQDLVVIAKDYVSQRVNAISEVEDVIRRLHDQLEQANQLLASAVTAQDRLGAFKPQVGMVYQCPRCWIFDDTQAAVRQTNRFDAEGRNAMCCDRCGTDSFVRS